MTTYERFLSFINILNIIMYASSSSKRHLRAVSIQTNIMRLRQVDETKVAECKQIMAETRFTEFPALCVYPGVGISRSAHI